MWAKLFAAMVVAVAVTGTGVYFALPENTPELVSDEISPASATHSCCGVRKVTGCSLATGEEPCSAAETVVELPTNTLDGESTAKTGCAACPTDALAACSGVMTVAATGGKITSFNCCAD